MQCALRRVEVSDASGASEMSWSMAVGVYRVYAPINTSEAD